MKPIKITDVDVSKITLTQPGSLKYGRRSYINYDGDRPFRILLPELTPFEAERCVVGTAIPFSQQGVVGLEARMRGWLKLMIEDSQERTVFHLGPLGYTGMHEGFYTSTASARGALVLCGRP
ncbi:hypothetical protein HK102_004453 [Quaeritorhiza haematococci]|nr:hypothetical protein HK102_004453 [Quaeritorhiza haematococci]